MLRTLTRCVLAALLSGAGAVAQSQAPQAESAAARTVTVGTHVRLTLPKEVQRIAVGDPDVLEVELLSTREALVLGKRTGVTTVLAFYDDEAHQAMPFRVQRDLTLLQAALADICDGVRAQIAPDRDALVLTGTVPDEEHRQAVLRAANSYLTAAPRNSVRVTEGSDGVSVLQDDAAQQRSQVIDLLRMEVLPATLEARILDAIRPIAGDDVRIRRLQRNPLSDDEQDVLVLEGSVPNQIALVRAMQLAARLFLGDSGGGGTNGQQRNNIQVLADEAGGLVNGMGMRGQSGGQGQGGGGQQGGGAGQGGRGGGFAGGGAARVQRNEIQRNLGRATVLSMARGRVLSFLEVEDRPQVRVSVQLFEVDRDRLFQFSSEVQLQGADFDQPALNASEIGSRIQPNPASVGAFSDSDVQAGLASLASGFSQQVQVSGQRLALDALLQALEARGIARRLSSPVLTVLNGESAQFQVGGEIPVPQAFTPAAGASAGLGTFASVDFRSFGVGLGVRPLVGEHGEVTLDLSSIVSQPDSARTTVVRDSTGTAPQTTAFATRSLQTNARLADGESLLVGGLVSRLMRNDNSKTPLLGDIPLLGWLFRSSNNNF
ncbi:MAG: pilus assembly protein N-terminal domain-containing protein, partial [Planctomycetota bacterium]|nr:pilus assembly protein N-terminal domain-containing protein [Planctomycetota bacterium]